MYEKHNWVNGEVITEDKLNHMEDGISTGGGIYTYEEVAAFDGEVTTVSDDTPYAEAYGITFECDLPKHDISVTFNGQDYTLPYETLEGGFEYWGEFADNNPSFTNFPVFVVQDGVATPEAGTYSLKINETVRKFTVNDDFKENMVVNVLEDTDTDNEFTLDKTYSEIMSALKKGKHIDFMWYKQSERAYEQFHLLYASSVEVALVRIYFNDGSPVLTLINFHSTTEDGYPTTKDLG